MFIYLGDDSHMTVLPRKKTKSKMVLSKPMSKKLTKKERKRLQKIVDKKNKKLRVSTSIFKFLNSVFFVNKKKSYITQIFN